MDGLVQIGEYNLLLRTLTKAKPGKHLHIQCVVRKMLKNTFDWEEIEIPIRLDE